MEPRNLDEKIREVFEERRLTPSDNAWEKLSNKLDTATTTKKRIGVWKYLIAASIVGIALISGLFWNTNEIVEKPINIVGTTIKKNEKNSISPKIDTKVVDNNTTIKPQKNTIPEPVLAKKEIAKKEPVINKEETIIPTPEKQITATQTIEPHQDTKAQLEKSTIERTPNTIDAAVAEVVMQVEKLQKTNGVTEAELDALLAQAQSRIKKPKIQYTTSKIDPSTLLMDVEFEMEKTFRDKVFNALGDGFKFIKTAVVQREN